MSGYTLGLDRPWQLCRFSGRYYLYGYTRQEVIAGAVSVYRRPWWWLWMLGYRVQASA